MKCNKRSEVGAAGCFVVFDVDFMRNDVCSASICRVCSEFLLILLSQF